MVERVSAYSKVTRQMVLDVKEDIKEIKENIGKLSNHYSKRLPLGATIAITFLTAVCSVLIGISLS